MILYTNGDSFVHGNGLGLDIFPGNTGDLSEIDDEEKTRLLKWSWEVKTDRAYAIYHAKMRSLESARAFPMLLKNMLGCSLVNSSMGGSSFDRIARTTITDLIKLKKKYPTRPIVAIIGNTDYFRKEIAYAIEGNVWFDLHLAHPGSIPREISSLGKFFVREETSYHRLVEYFKNWITIKEFCKNNNIRFYFLKVFDHNFIGDAKPDDLAALEEYANVVPDVDMTLVAQQVEKRYCPDGGHFSAPVHKLVAEEFFKRIKA